MIDIAIVFLCYLAGSLPFAVWLCRINALKDPRHYGTMNPGTTNVSRQSKIISLAVLACDITKAYVTLFAVLMLTDTSVWLLPTCSLAIMLGHCYSIFLQGHGGKGIATGVGCLLAIDPLLAVVMTSIWLITMLCCQRFVYIASIATSLIGTIWGITMLSVPSLWPQNHQAALILFIVSAVATWRHRHDFKRLNAKAS